LFYLVFFGPLFFENLLQEISFFRYCIQSNR
jgi:hypothetical protein